MYHVRMFKSNDPADWASVSQWRKETRNELSARRLSVSPAERRSAQESIGQRLHKNFPELGDAAIGFYWPIKGEVDLRPLMQTLSAEGADLALPVVVEKNQPLEFWAWDEDTRMTRGGWNIPVPAERSLLIPNILLVPLLGFDAAGYRLGFGGGYYDRSLAAFRLRPMTIGIGYEFSRLPTIFPQAHDIPMDAIVTDTSCVRFPQDSADKNEPASPPCYQHEFDDTSDTT
mgnify:CR=1 FL=1